MLEAGATPSTLLMLATGLGLMVAFVMVERRVDDPLVALSVFRDRAFMVNIVCLFISFVAIGVYELMTPFYLQDARGFSPDAAGLIFCVIPLANAIAGPISGAVSDRIGCERLRAWACSCSPRAFCWWAFSGEETGLVHILICLGLASLGTSIFQSPNNSLVMGSLPREALGFGGQPGRACPLFGHGDRHQRVHVAALQPNERGGWIIALLRMLREDRIFSCTDTV